MNEHQISSFLALLQCSSNLPFGFFLFDQCNQVYKKEHGIKEMPLRCSTGIGFVGEESSIFLFCSKKTLKPKRERILEILKEVEE